jgi:hypothetical protein
MFYISSSPLQIISIQILNAAYVASVMGAGLAWFQSAMPNKPTLALVFL